jgi:hypothetical protein
VAYTINSVPKPALPTARQNGLAMHRSIRRLPGSRLLTLDAQVRSRLDMKWAAVTPVLTRTGEKPARINSRPNVRFVKW